MVPQYRVSFYVHQNFSSVKNHLLGLSTVCLEYTTNHMLTLQGLYFIV